MSLGVTPSKAMSLWWLIYHVSLFVLFLPFFIIPNNPILKVVGIFCRRKRQYDEFSIIPLHSQALRGGTIFTAGDRV
jgi:hypothetical protein